MLLRRTRILIPLLAASLAGVAALAPPAAAQSKSDKALLKAGVITKNDVPSGWTSKKSRSTSTPDRSIAECKKIRTATDSAKKKTPRAQSREFDQPNSDTNAESTVYAFRDSNAAAKFLSAYQDADASPCLEKVAAKAVGSRGTASQSPITDLQGVGDDAVGFEEVLTSTENNQLPSLYVDLVVVRVGRAVVGFSFTNAGERIPDGPTIVRTVIARVAAAQGSA